MDKIKKIPETIKVGFSTNKITLLLAVGIWIPIIISFLICDNEIMPLLIVPILYRLIGNLILKKMREHGRCESIAYFNIFTRLFIIIGFVILSLLFKNVISEFTGVDNLNLGNALFFGIICAYFDKLAILILNAIFHVNLGSSNNESAINGVNDMLAKTKNTYTQPDGTVVYRDKDGIVIGTSKTSNGETLYWNSNLSYIGKSKNENNGTTEYYDKDLNYKGKSKKESNGTTEYYDEKLNYKGKSKEYSDGSSTHIK